MKPRLAVGRDLGLPSNQARGLAIDRCGRLWLPGPDGLACHDGHHVGTFDRRHGLVCARLRAGSVGADGTARVGADLGLEALAVDARAAHWSGRSPWPCGLGAGIGNRLCRAVQTQTLPHAEGAP